MLENNCKLQQAANLPELAGKFADNNLNLKSARGKK
jgi:hypothetical protein